MIINAILTNNQVRTTEFTWFRNRTRFDPDKDDGIATIKNLADVFSSPDTNNEKRWNEGNTVIIDDEWDKVRFNNPENAILIPSYSGDVDDKVLFGLLQEITDRFAALRKK